MRWGHRRRGQFGKGNFEFRFGSTKSEVFVGQVSRDNELVLVVNVGV